MYVFIFFLFFEKKKRKEKNHVSFCLIKKKKKGKRSLKKRQIVPTTTSSQLCPRVQSAHVNVARRGEEHETAVRMWAPLSCSTWDPPFCPLPTICQRLPWSHQSKTIFWSIQKLLSSPKLWNPTPPLQSKKQKAYQRLPGLDWNLDIARGEKRYGRYTHHNFAPLIHPNPPPQLKRIRTIITSCISIPGKS